MRGFDPSLLQLYVDDPERADAVVFGRRTGPGRRGFLQGAGLAAMGAALGGIGIPFAANMPAGLIPAALAQGAGGGPKLLQMPGKAALVMLGDRPLVAETPEHLLDEDVTSNDRFFIRNNGNPPEPVANPDAWELVVDGEVNSPLRLTVGELKSRFPSVTYQLMLECGGNGRSAFVPQARGNQWTNGGAGCARWTGVRLRDLLQAAGPRPSAVYTAHYGADTHLSGEAGRVPLSRGVRIEKAMEEHTLVAFAMNGEPIPHVHGGPVRLVVPGWAGSASHKWLSRIWIRDREHDGPGMTGTAYRVPTVPIIPGSESQGEGFRILESMPVRAIITNVPNGTELPAGTREIPLRGHAWAGERTVRAVHVSADYGQTWQAAEVGQPANKYAWQSWRGSVHLPTRGYYELWVRATDSEGVMQPHVAANWNPQGYGGNALHRVAVLVPS
ncbi:MAG TPA: sulfite oxidase [Azospirillaceae bacterium]|nr:sulfite oxidase [Azospirillaceae bacterium]